jgi:predicted alpha/beta hydrolase
LSAIAVEPEEFRVVFDDGASVAARWYAPPAARETQATLLCLPALGVPAAFYVPLARAFAASGVAMVTADLRGNGASSVRASRGVDFNYARLVADAAQLVQAIRARSGVPLYALGHSLGGHVAALLAGRMPEAFDGLVLCACGTNYARCFPGPTRLLVYGLSLAASTLGPVVGHFPGERLGFGGREAASLMREWGRLARGGRFEIEGFDGEAALAAARLDTLMISLAHDHMAPVAAVEHLAGKLSSARVVRVHLDETHAERQSLDHLRWAKSPAAVVAAVHDWLGRTG